MAKALQPGDKVKLPSGRTGMVLTAAGGPIMPNHCLIQLDSGDRQWFLASIVLGAD